MNSRKIAGGDGVPHKYLCLAGMDGVKLRGAPKKEAVDSETKLAQEPAQDLEIPDVQTLIVQNPAMNAASFFNLLVSKGFRVVKETQVSAPALDRAGVKKESSIQESGTACRMLESAGGSAGVDANGNARFQNRFRAILIQEGLGNLKDGFFYTKEALRSAVPVFEGRKFYADHPSSFEEEVRPERSVRDVYGHFENIEYKEAEDGTGQLHGDIVVLTDESADWVRARLVHAIEYAKKYPDKDFLGLSINASGDAAPVPAEEFLQREGVVKSAIAKVQEAIAGGLTEIKVVNTIDQATSCDLVTEAGAKGKVLQMLEANRMAKHESEKKEAEAEEKKKEAEEAAPAAHDDEQADKELILSMLKKHGLIGGEEEQAEEAAPADGEPPVHADADAEEKPEGEEKAPAKEAEEGEEAKMMKAAMHYHQAYKAAGYEAAEAADRAVEAMKCAKHAHEAMEAAEAAHKEAKEDECKEAEEKKEAHKESGEVIKLKGENAALKERLAKLEVEKYLDKKLQESRLPMSVTKRFRESVKSGFKSTKEVDEKFKSFIEGYQAFSGEAASLDEFVMTEKNTGAATGEISLADCVEE